MTQRPPRDHQWRQLAKQQTQRHKKQNTPCALCGQPINYNAPPTRPDSPTIDHKQSWATHPHLRYDPANLQPTHRQCNSHKGTNPTALPTTGNQSRQWT